MTANGQGIAEGGNRSTSVRLKHKVDRSTQVHSCASAPLLAIPCY